MARERGGSRARVVLTLVPTNPVAAAPISRITKISNLEEAAPTLEVEWAARGSGGSEGEGQVSQHFE